METQEFYDSHLQGLKNLIALVEEKPESYFENVDLTFYHIYDKSTMELTTDKRIKGKNNYRIITYLMDSLKRLVPFLFGSGMRIMVIQSLTYNYLSIIVKACPNKAKLIEKLESEIKELIELYN